MTDDLRQCHHDLEDCRLLASTRRQETQNLYTLMKQQYNNLQERYDAVVATATQSMDQLVITRARVRALQAQVTRLGGVIEDD